MKIDTMKTVFVDKEFGFAKGDPGLVRVEALERGSEPAAESCTFKVFG